MLERKRTRSRKDLNELADSTAEEATSEGEDNGLKGPPMPEFEEQETPSGKNPHAVALGRRGGLKGGKARAERLTAAQRSDIARRAAEARWHKRGD